MRLVTFAPRSGARSGRWPPVSYKLQVTSLPCQSLFRLDEKIELQVTSLPAVRRYRGGTAIPRSAPHPLIGDGSSKTLKRFRRVE